MSKLYIVPTPIGNLKDITFRAVETLNIVDLILAEDTRTSGKLLNHYEIKTPMVSYHMHNEHRVLESVIEKLQSGLNIAIISEIIWLRNKDEANILALTKTLPRKNNPIYDPIILAKSMLPTCSDK